MNVEKHFLSGLGFSLLGFVIGVLVGLSRTPVVDVAIPAILTFLGGLITYIFITKGNSTYNTSLANLILIVIPIFLLYGVEVSSAHRFTMEEYLRDREEWLETRLIEQNHQNEVEMSFLLDSLKQAQYIKVKD